MEKAGSRFTTRDARARRRSSCEPFTHKRPFIAGMDLRMPDNTKRVVPHAATRTWAAPRFSWEGLPMSRIKIVSNPYELDGHIDYEVLDADEGQWAPIDIEHAPNSQLVSKRLTRGFFPFKMDEAVDEIVKEFGGDGGVDIVFEGPGDEYEDLKATCCDDRFRGGVHLEKSPRHLINAREIKPDIVRISKDLNPLIIELSENDATISEDLKKFYEVSSDTIPIVVLGNYSSGKSTFINALIGAEYLPSSIDPFTAKVYKIKAGQSGMARLAFSLDGREATITLDGTEATSSNIPSSDVLRAAIASASDEADGDLVCQVNKVLECLNNFDDEAENPRISDLIQVEVPFSGVGLLRKSEGKEFVIFDTPGPNSVTNARHKQVLQEEVERLSNGIPILVTEYSDLDATDSLGLYNGIKDMRGLDKRFTMIVVSKADQEELPEDAADGKWRRRLMGQALPKNMYSQGIYFVSSLMGLGSKNGGDFLGRNFGRLYKRQLPDYEDPESEFYTKLYDYDIMPTHLKQEAAGRSLDCRNRVFANSGLLCVEYEVQTFAEKYAPYNQCRLLLEYLRSAYSATDARVAEALEQLERTRRELTAKLDEDQRRLATDVDARYEQIRHQAESECDERMSSFAAQLSTRLTIDEAKSQDQEIRRQKNEEFALDSEKEDVSVAWETLLTNVRRGLQDVVKHHDAAAVSYAGDSILHGFKRVLREMNEVDVARTNANRASVDAFIASVNDGVDAGVEQAKEILYESSAQYWREWEGVLRGELLSIITGTKGISEEGRARLSSVVSEFPPIEFGEVEDFHKEEFLLHPFERLSIHRIVSAYNKRLNSAVTQMVHSVQESHTESYRIWSGELLSQLIEGIVDLSPALSKQREAIDWQTQRLENRKERRGLIGSYMAEIESKMDWRMDEMPDE